MSKCSIHIRLFTIITLAACVFFLTNCSKKDPLQKTQAVSPTQNQAEQAPDVRVKNEPSQDAVLSDNDVEEDVKETEGTDNSREPSEQYSFPTLTKPQVRMNHPIVTGNLDKRLVQKVFRMHTGELRACYEKELAKNKDLSGDLTINWNIEPQGTVSNVEIMDSTMPNPTMEKCLVSTVKTWKFSVPDAIHDPIQVSYPLSFLIENQ